MLRAPACPHSNQMALRELRVVLTLSFPFPFFSFNYIVPFLLHRNEPRATQSEMAPFFQYWAFRQDQSWAAVPGYMRRVNRKSTEKVFIDTVNQILDGLTSHESMKFNPSKIWYDTLAEEEKQKLLLLEAAEENEKESSGKPGKKEKKSGGGGGPKNKKKTETAEEIQLRVQREAAESRLYRDIIKIRNTKEALLPLLREMKSRAGRIVLMVELLKQSMESKDGDLRETTGKKAETFDILWAIEAFGFEEFALPAPVEKDLTTRRNYGLVFDDYSKVKKLIKSARDKMRAEDDMIKMQLVDMFDRLPPLTKFSFGFKLDNWQKRVLRWIDAGRSVIVCAPTSSGKTVLSSYVAFPKSKRPSDDEEDEKEKSSNKKAGPREKTLTELEEDEENFLEDEEDEEGSDGEDDSEDEDDEAIAQVLSEASLDTNRMTPTDYLRAIPAAAKADRKRRLDLIDKALEFNLNRVLFVVPTEPLVWQVGAYFSRLLKEEGDKNTRVGIVTHQMRYHPFIKYGVMPQIVVGTPLALEDVLSKVRGAVGEKEVYGIAQKDIMPGGFDQFDWVIYDEVHALDGEEGDALQRLIRTMSCKFLALSATVGNAEQLRGWFEQVKGDQLDVELVNVAGGDSSANLDAKAEKEVAAIMPPPPPTSEEKDAVRIKCHTTLDSDTLIAQINNLTHRSTVADLKAEIAKQWQKGEDNSPGTLQIFLGNPVLAQAKLPDQVCADLAFDDMTLEQYGFKTYTGDLKESGASEEPTAAEATGMAFDSETGCNLVTAYRYVNQVTHTVRFINLQRYVWDDGSKQLKEVSPLAAVETVEDLKNGILDKSSLSFTSKDSYRLWLKLQDLFPEDAISHLNPSTFFDVDERITLARTKEYEDFMKASIKSLAHNYPKECQELLYVFRLEDASSNELDLCELVMKLKEQNMTPCLPFHLNAFEAIKLFQQLLAGLEYRQKVKYPNYYTNEQKERDAKKSSDAAAIKSKGRNKKEEEEAKKSGDIEVSGSYEMDVYEPHKAFLTGDTGPLNEDEIRKLSDEMERYDGFEKRERSAMSHNPGGNANVLGHALMRGLRRGIGLFINEVSFPAYRRTVMKLASKGALSVVISDDSLAFGVNMPFRSCVFCGEMYDKEKGTSLLTPLMAQQMSGRAGRRGLDTQGNLVYVGSRAKFIRKLMLGEVSNITGRNFEPRYPVMFLQSLLSPRHTGIGRVDVIGKTTLFEFVQNSESKLAQLKGIEAAPVAASDKEKEYPDGENYSLTTSLDLMVKFNFIAEDKGEGLDSVYVPNAAYEYDNEVLSLIWVLRSNKYECIVIGRLFNELYEHMRPMQTWLTETDKEKVTKVVNIFLSMILVLIDRTECPADEESLQENSYFRDPERAATLNTWLGYYADIWHSLPEYLRDPVGPFDKEGNATRLDGTLFRALLDRHYQHTLTESKKQMLKGRLWSVGQTIRKMHNYTWQGDKYVKCMTHALRACFKLIKYTNGELIQAIVNFDNVSDVLYESRTTDAKTGKGTAKVIEQSQPWADHMIKDVSAPIEPLSWSDCISTCVSRLNKIRTDTGVKWSSESEEGLKKFNEAIGRLQDKFTMSSPAYKAYSSGTPDRPADIKVDVEGDRKLIKALLDYNDKASADHLAALHACSAGGVAQGDDKYTLGKHDYTSINI